jgi:hypothetical protein
VAMIDSKTFPRVLRSAMAATVPILSSPGFFSGIVIGLSEVCRVIFGSQVPVERPVRQVG